MMATALSVPTRPLFLGGDWRLSDTVAEIRRPWDGQPVARVSLATPHQADEAVARAVTAFDTARRLSSAERAGLLRALAEGVKARRREFEETMVAEAGKPRQLVRAEIERGLWTLQLAAEEAHRIGGELRPFDQLPAHAGRFGLVRRVPIGPVLGIPAFNFPFNLVAHKIAPPLAAGNPVLLKPAPQTPLTSLLLAEIFATTGAPPGMLSVLPCTNEVAERLVQDERIKALTFTGSSRVGWRLKQLAGKKRMLLELGGNAGAIVDETADLEHAARRSAFAAFAYAGQVCVSLQRLFVQATVYEAFLRRFLEVVRSLPVGDPTLETTVVGPMISDEAADRAEQLIAEAVAQGARVLTGGTRTGRLVFPTVLTDVSPTMRVFREEAFAPVVTLSPFTDLDDALRQVNDTPYGLAAAIFSDRLPHVIRAFDRLDVGSLIVNDGPMFRADNGPFGGVKDSGLGREAVRETIEQMTDLKLLVLG